MPRRHDIDALRVFAFALLIAYHLGMVYVAEWGYHAKSTYQAEWLQWPMIALNRWRMPLLFMISGIALGLAMAARPGWRLALSRSWRLLLPLLFGMLAIVPVQAYCEALGNGAIEPDFGAFMARYLQLRPWAGGGWSGAEYGITWNHLWYLAYVWTYSMLLLALTPVLESAAGTRLRNWLFDRPRIFWVLVPSAWLFAGLWWLMPRWPETHALVGDWYAHAKYLFFFAAGWLVAGEARFWTGLVAMRRTTLALALLAISLELSLRAAGRYLPPGDIPAWALRVDWAMIERMARATYAWTALLAIFGWSRTLLDRPFQWLPSAREAVFPWYVLHQSLIVPLAFSLSPLALGPWLEPLLVGTGTIAGCAILHMRVIARIRWLRPFFGLPPRPSRQASRYSTTSWMASPPR
ncbi:membrane protein [Luteimonas padinae]|uniref:Acyltransferase family protein n=1 Tax=Luteimonas padinae TaxID=1714359 RepID=A0ABV6SZL6_9GAMM|nr:acyltransferase family protein [Luteimonas padinae]GHD66991.1 membrane protein [Luteimonas padinae]